MPHSFTISYPKITGKIISDVGVYNQIPDGAKVVPWDPKYKALWDTGATKTCVSKKLARQLQLKPVGYAFIHSASGYGDEPSPAFHVGITLPNKVFISELKVLLTDLPDDFDVLIGMDIINKGDFAISNRNGKTVFTFRTPSVAEIDFVSAKKANEKIGRNSKCPCGSGKKHKFCCERKEKVAETRSEKK